MKKKMPLAAIALSTIMASSTGLAADAQISGKVFFDYSFQDHTTAAGTTSTSGANITRTYLTAKKKVNKTWSTNITLDSSLNAGHNGKRNEVFLKKAQLTGKFSKAINAKLGMIATPWVGYEDKLSQHRHVAKSFVDTHKMASSADAGIGVFGQLMDGMVSYDAVSINGGGYANTATSEKTDIEFRVGVKPIEGLSVDLGYRSGYQGAFVAGNTENQISLTQLMVTYGKTVGDLSYRVALNSISNKIVDQLPGGATTTESGTEIWAWARSGEFGGYFRSESLDNGLAGKATEKRTLFGVDYYAAKDLMISLVSDTSTDIGGTAGNDIAKTTIASQFKF